MSFNDLAKREAAAKKAAEEKKFPKPQADTEETPANSSTDGRSNA